MKLISAYDKWQNAACKHTNQLSFGNLVKFGIISKNGGPNTPIFHSLTVTKRHGFSVNGIFNLPIPHLDFFDFKPWNWVLCYFSSDPSGCSSAASQMLKESIFTTRPFGVPTTSQGEQKLGRLKFFVPIFCYTNKQNSWSKVGKNQSQHQFFIKKSCKPSTMNFSPIKTQPDMIFP